MHPNPRKVLPVVLLIAIAAAGWWYFSGQNAQANSGVLAASGTIESTQVDVSPELGGKVLEVSAQEGDQVSAGQVLVHFDDATLQAQLSQAQAAVTVAQANYKLIAAGPTAEQRQLAIASAEMEVINAQLAIQDLYDKADLAAAQMQQNIADIDKKRDLAVQQLDNLIGSADQADIDAAWSAVVLAKDRLDRAQDKFDPFEKRSEDNVTRALLQSKVAEAQKQYDAVVTRYNNIVGTSNQYDMAVAQANVSLAEAQLADARQQYEDLKNGPDPDALEKANARLAVAQANLAAAKAEPSAEQLAVAQAQIDSAVAALQAIQVQIDKLQILAPADGVVLSRSVEPGEVVAPSVPLLTLSRLDELKITVYLPEDRYGTIRLGQEAAVSVDSFPGATFQANVVRIADQAEFTPRNVQTDEGRRTMVFAIELTVSNPDGRLKPGMPADVDFGN